MQGEVGQLQQQLDQRDRDVAILEADIVQALRDVRDAARGETEALHAAETEREVRRWLASHCAELDSGIVNVRALRSHQLPTVCRRPARSITRCIAWGCSFLHACFSIMLFRKSMHVATQAC